MTWNRRIGYAKSNYKVEYRRLYKLYDELETEYEKLKKEKTMSEDEYKEIYDRMEKSVKLEGNRSRNLDHKDAHEIEMQLLDFLRNRNYCRIRFCHNSVYEFGFCEKHWLDWEQLFKEFFARTHVLDIKVLEVSPQVRQQMYVQGSAYNRNYGKYKKSYTAKHKPAPVREEEPKITAVEVNAAKARMDALKAKLAARRTS